MGLRTAFRKLYGDLDVSSLTRRDLSGSVAVFTTPVSVGILASGLNKIVDVTVTGIAATDQIVGFTFQPASADVDISYTCYVRAANSVRLTAIHDAATTPTPTAGTILTLFVLRP